jgi:hypothetical protein
MRVASSTRNVAGPLPSVSRTAANDAYQRVITQKWILGVLLIQFACQLGLLFESLGSLRVGFRALSFGISLLALALAKGRPLTHPARLLGGSILVWLVIQIFHPSSNSFLSAFAQVALYASILSPIFWVLRLRPSFELFGRFIAILFLFHVTSSVFGVLQVYFPGRFQPALSSVVTGTEHGAAALEIVLASGERTLRPMGLTDIPGGAAMSGLYAIIFGIGFYAAGNVWWQRWGGVSGVFIGLFCIYLSHVRSVLILAVFVLIGFTFFLFQIGRLGVAGRLALVIPALLIGSFVWAISIGGDSMVERFSTLFNESPVDVYQSNRGRFLQSTIENEIPKYPLGAGLGRWGMMYAYFGDHSLDAPSSLWAEIQWTAWTYDGGIPLICAYALAVIATIRFAYRITIRNRDNAFGLWAALILTYDLAAFVLTFSYSLFIGQTGFEFWFLNSMLIATSAGMGRRQA